MAAGSSSGIERLVATPPLPGFTGDHTHAQHPEQLQQEMKLIRHKLFKCFFFLQSSCVPGTRSTTFLHLCSFFFMFDQVLSSTSEEEQELVYATIRRSFQIYIYIFFFSRKTMSEFGVLRGL